MDRINELLKKFQSIAENNTRNGVVKAKTQAELEAERLTAIKNRWSESRRKVIRYYSSTPRRYQRSRLGNYRPGNPSQADAKARLTDYVRNIEENFKLGRSIIICGSVGTGKTHLSYALAWCFYKKFFVEQMLFEKLVNLRTEFFRSHAYADNSHFDVDTLIVDEVSPTNEFEKKLIFELIEHRYREMLPTVIISNKNVQDLTYLCGARVIDRLKDNGGLIINLTGNSHRQ